MCGATVIGLDPSMKTATATNTTTGSATAVLGIVWAGSMGQKVDKILNKRASYQRVTFRHASHKAIFLRKWDSLRAARLPAPSLHTACGVD